MKCITIKLFFIILVLCCMPLRLVANDLPDTLQLEFCFEGFGNMVMYSPPYYSGDIIPISDPLLLGGAWWIQLDDTGWPPPSDPVARWEHIFNEFYVYNATSQSWTAHFDGGTLASPPIWEFTHPTNGTMGGTLVIVSTFTDDDHDEVLDLEERMFGVFSGTLIVMKYGTGLFAGYCGQGSYSGYMLNDDPANFVDDYVYGCGLLDLVNCSIGSQISSWSNIKQKYSY